MTRVRKQTWELRHKTSIVKIDPYDDFIVNSAFAALEPEALNGTSAEVRRREFRPVPDRKKRDETIICLLHFSSVHNSSGDIRWKRRSAGFN